MNYNFYIKKINSADDTEYAIGERWPSFQMKDISGLPNDGDPTNFYVERFADTGYTKKYVGAKSTDGGTVVMNVMFYGDTYVSDYHSFTDFLSTSFVQYRDTYREETVQMYMSKAPSITADVRYGEGKRIEVSYTFEKVTSDFSEQIEQMKDSITEATSADINALF